MKVLAMRKFTPILLLTVMFCFFSSCEKDDICVDGDTPLLVIGFFDSNDNEVAKDVPTLRVRAVGFDTSPQTFTDRSAQDSVGIPLQIGANTTSFVFIKSSADDDDGMETGNIDTLTLNYEVVEKFVSRACGYVANFENLSPVLETDNDNWIQGVSVERDTIENSLEIHVKIFH